MASNQALFTLETILNKAVLANANTEKEDDSWDVKITFDPSIMPQILKELASLAIFDLKVSIFDESGIPVSDNKAFAVNEIRVKENVMFILFSTRIIVNGKTIASSKLKIDVGCSIVFKFKKKTIRILEIRKELK